MSTEMGDASSDSASSDQARSDAASDVVVGDDGVTRCSWGASPPLYAHYHDTEWGFGETDDAALFEKICLEGFQAGLSWWTILSRRDRFREVFAQFDPVVVAAYGDDEVATLVVDAGIIRHEQKIRSAINNAQRCLETIDEFGSLASYVWQYADLSDVAPSGAAAVTPTSTAFAKDLKARGFTFVGPTTIYAFMQAMGLVNDHFERCDRRAAAQASRVAAAATVTLP